MALLGACNFACSEHKLILGLPLYDPHGSALPHLQPVAAEMLLKCKNSSI